MGVKKVAFNHDGGDINVDIQYTGLVAASYTYTLWEANSNAIVDQKPGNNQNPQDDNYDLPTPVAANAGRLIDVHSTVQGLYKKKDEGAYKVIITITQDGNILDKDIQPTPPKVIGNQVAVHQYYSILQ